MAGKTWLNLNCLKHHEIKDLTKKRSFRKDPNRKAAEADDPHSQRSDPEGCIDHHHNEDIAITEDLIDPEYLLDPPENWRLDIDATSAKELASNGHCRGVARRGNRSCEEKERGFAEVILPPNKMSVAVQVVNGREQGTEEEELRESGGVANVAVGGAQAMDTKEEEELAPISPREDVMSDSELDQSGAPKKKKFKAWKSIKKIFKKKKSSKGSESDSSRAPNKSKSKSTGELEIGGDEEGELNKRISMSEDSVFTPDKNTSAKDRNSYSLNTSNLADEISAKLKERASSSDDGYAQSSEDAMTMGDTTHDNSYVAPSDSSKTDSGIITTEDEDRVMSKPRISDRRWKSFTSIGVKDTHHVTAEMKRLKKDNPGDVDLDLIQTSKLLSSSAAKHRISVAPSNRRPSKKGRARTPQKRSSSRLDDAPSPIAEEPTTPSKSPAPFDLDSELPFPGVALSMSAPTQQHTNGSSSLKTKASLGLGPMVLPPILFGPKGNRSRKTESTPPPSDFKSSSSSGLPSDSAILPTLGDRIASEETNRDDKLENQKNGVSRGKGRHEDVEKLLDVDPSLFGDSDKLRDDDSTKKVGGNDGKGELTFGLEGDGLGLFETGVGGKEEDCRDGEGLGIADLDLLVDLPDPLDLGKNMFGVETIIEEDEEEDEEVGHEMDGSDDFLEDESSIEEVEFEEEEVKEKVKVGTVAAMVNNVEVEIRKSPSPPGERRAKGREMEVEKKKEVEAKNTPIDDDMDVTRKDKLGSFPTENELKLKSDVEAKSVVADDVAVDMDTSNDKDDDDNDVNDSNYPGINGRPPCEDSVNGTAKLTCKDEEKGDTPKNEGVPVVIIESPSSEDLKISKDTTLEDGEEEEDEEPMILPTVPKEVIIIMKDDPKKEPEAEAKPTTPTTPQPPAMPVEEEAPEADVPASPPPTEMKKKEEVEKESSETEKDVEEIKKEEEDAAIVEERRLSVAASKALFEAKIPASEPVKSTSSNKAIVNGNGSPNTNARRSSQPTETVPETKAEADTKLSEKEEKKDEEEAEKDEVAFSDKEENLEAEESKEEPVSLRDRISRYQSLATKNPVKGLTSHTPSRNSPTKQRPASTSNIENKDSPKKIAPKVPSKPSSTSSNKPSGSTATTTEPSRQSTNPTPSSSTQSSSSRKPLQPKIDRCMVCDKPVYPNEMSKFEGRVFHRTCQKCSECSRSLTLWNLDIAEDRLYCKQHGTVVKNNQLKEKLII